MTAARKIKPATELVEAKHVASFALTADAERFAKAARIAATFTSTDDGRAVLTAIRVLSDGEGTFVFEATDSYRLVKLTLRNVGSRDSHPAKFDALIPAKWFATNLPKRPRRIGFGIDLTDANVTVRDAAEHTSATAPLKLGDYPNTESIWSGTSDHVDGIGEVVGLNPGYLSKMLKACETWGGGPWGGIPVRIQSLDAIKPIRFDVSGPDGDLSALQMPVRLS